MNILKIEIERAGTIHNSKQMAYNNEKEFFTALVTLCDELGVEVPIWSAHEERILEKNDSIRLDIDDSGVLRISNCSE